MISTSEIKISVVVDEKYLKLGVRALHTAFELTRVRPRFAWRASSAPRGSFREPRLWGRDWRSVASSRIMDVCRQVAYLHAPQERSLEMRLFQPR